MDRQHRSTPNYPSDWRGSSRSMRLRESQPRQCARLEAARSTSDSTGCMLRVLEHTCAKNGESTNISGYFSIVARTYNIVVNSQVPTQVSFTSTSHNSAEVCARHSNRRSFDEKQRSEPMDYHRVISFTKHYYAQTV